MIAARFHGAVRRWLAPGGLVLSAVGLAAVGLAACSASPSGHAVASSSSAPPLSTTNRPGGPTTRTPPPGGPAGAIGPVYVEPDAGITPIYAFMRAARSRLTMTMYELADPTAEQILVADASRGVRVQVLLDSALEAVRNQAARAFLSTHGVAVALAPAARITHQKTICTDDTRCLVMSLNLVADDYATTRDVAVEDGDGRDVSAIESTFAADFAGGTAPAVSGGDHLLWSPGSEPAILEVINGARRSVAVENEEMDSAAVTDALASAARRGVDVEVCMTETTADAAALGRIAAAGGHVHLYPDRDGVLYIHEKLVLADAGTTSAKAVAGSINFSTASLDENRELDLVLDPGDAPEGLATLAATFRRDVAGAPAR